MNEAKVTVEIFDTTLRDGAQALDEEHQFRTGSKWAIAGCIAGLGVGIIEAGIPVTPGDDIEVKNVAKTVGIIPRSVQQWRNGEIVGVVERPPVIAGLARTTPQDVDVTWESVQYAKRPRIHTFISTDPEHMAAKFPGKSPDEVLKMGLVAIQRSVEYVSEVPGASVEFSAEAASTTEPEFLVHAVKMAAENGVNVINLPDTVGQRDPIWMYRAYRKYIDWVHSINPDVTISAHNHNDFGMAVANSLMLVRAATDHAFENNVTVKTQIETTICGLGERAGNADVFPIAAGLDKFSSDGTYRVPVEWEFNIGSSYKVARSVLRHANMIVQPKSPIVGDETNVHRTGIHSDGIIKGGYQIYTPFDMTKAGHASQAVHQDGKYQGKNGRSAIVST